MSLSAEVEAVWRQWFAKGMAEIQRGNFAQALEHMKAALQLQPEHLDTLYNVARLHEELQQWDAALAGYDLCLSKQVHWPAVWNNRGNVLRALGDWVKAEQAYRRCLEIDPSVAAFVLPNLGQTCCALGRVQEGVQIYQQALTLQPHPETWNNLGVAYSSEAHYTDALHAFTQAVTLHPGFATAWGNLGAALQKTRQFQKAIEAFEKAVQLTPQLHELWCQYGHCLREARSFVKAKSAYEKSLQLNPSQSETKLALAHVAFEMLDLKSAKRYVQEVLHDEPENTQAWWTQVILSVAPVTRSWSDARSEREDLLHALDALCQAQSRQPTLDWGQHAVPKTLFYLAYQELNHRDVLTRFGDACMQAVSSMQPVSTTCSATTTKIRLGVVSEFFHSHSVWEALIKGWVDGLDPHVVELHLFDLGKMEDEQTQHAKAHAYRYAKCTPDVKACIAEIEASHLDVLMYPDLGISAMAYRLASLRLAPVQWATWGHPETTGLRTIDGFVSADALEPDDAQAHYVEPLIRLPNLGCAVSPPMMQARAPDLAAHGLDLTRPMLVCGGTPFKYSAAFDELLVNVAKQNPSCTIVLFDYTANLHYSQALKSRLEEAFKQHNLDPEKYLCWLPWLPGEEFLGLLSQADVFLDSLGFSGFNTAIQALHCRLPVVAYEGKFLRGRLASGVLRHLGLNELVVQDVDAYVSVVTRLLNDAMWHDSIRKRISTQLPKIFNDESAIQSLQRHLVACVKK